MAAALRAALSRSRALKRYAVSLHSFGARLYTSANPSPDQRLTLRAIQGGWRRVCHAANDFSP